MTANALASDQQKCFEAGMDGYLPKPFKKSQLYQIVANYLGIEPSGCQDIQLKIPFSSQRLLQQDNKLPVLEHRALLLIRYLQQPGAPDLLKTALDSYLTELAEVRGTLQRALEAGDATNVRSLAHRLKSGSADLGAARLAEWFKCLEKTPSVATPEEISNLLAAFDRAVTEYRSALNAFMDGDGMYA